MLVAEDCVFDVADVRAVIVFCHFVRPSGVSVDVYLL